MKTLNEICKKIATRELGKPGMSVLRMSNDFGMPSGGVYVVKGVWPEMSAIKIGKSWCYATEFRRAL